MKKIFFAIIGLLVAVYFFTPRPESPTTPRKNVKPTAVKPSKEPSREVSPSRPGKTSEVQVTPAQQPEVLTAREGGKHKVTLPYKIQNGLMIVQGDLVAGAPTREDVPDAGFVIMSPVKIWPRGIIPYHIQPNVQNPDRVLQAIAMFDGTAVHLTPQKGEENVLVFEQGDKDCLSYVGQMGGKQPLWISPECKPDDIAHEILHALGFIHEQNRADRDGYVDMHFDNIDERYVDNFEKLPVDFMKVSGLGEFDFQSLMIYPQWMFAKNGQSTMDPKVRDRLIQPGTRLSAGDIDRLNKAYGH